MKYVLLLFVFLVFLSCNCSKKATKNDTHKQTTLVEENNTNKNELIVELNNPNQINDSKELIKNSGLVWDKLLVDNDAAKVAVIKVPLDKKDFWQQRLQQSGMFKLVEPNKKSTIKKIQSEIENTLVFYKKNPCFGPCPVYEMRVYNSGKVLYHGLQHVLVSGKKEFKLTKEQFSTLKEKLAHTSFSTYKKQYRDSRLMDASSVYISYNKKQIEISAWQNVPNELVEVINYLNSILIEKNL
ncbi:DUF6438 domain-containing protein [Tenacibaculum sp. UWU-22]|uniref:DUF6438 domain-containing protein n=1 Tax=Tenacibaculum sp. UWU-22 TaxID=3234187 RepID=UPI0034DAEF3B